MDLKKQLLGLGGLPVKIPSCIHYLAVQILSRIILDVTLSHELFALFLSLWGWSNKSSRRSHVNMDISSP